MKTKEQLNAGQANLYSVFVLLFSNQTLTNKANITTTKNPLF